MLFLLVLPFLLLSTYRATRWAQNYISAGRYDLPIILLRVSFEDLWWMPLRPLFAWVQHLPFGLGNWYLYTTMGWPTEDLNASVLKYGENFVLCSPSGNTLVSSEAAVIETVYGGKRGGGFTRVKGEWRRPDAQSQLFAFYGQNVSSTNGEEWRRHRKVTAQAFNEQTMRHCWEESCRQASKLAFEPGGGSDLVQVRRMFDALAMRVLTIVGFGQERGSELTSVPVGHRETLFECLEVILQNILLTVVFHSLRVPNLFLPAVLKKLKVSVCEFKLYMEESVLQHMQTTHTKASSSESSGRSRSLLESLICANEAGKSEETKQGTRPSYLTESELYSNIFVFNLAGYETTSGTLTLALPYLAAHPELQDWVCEEFKDAFTNSEMPDYTTTYPNLVRCQAIMYETLRLASHPPLLVKAPTAPAHLTITTPTGPLDVTIPPGTQVGFNMYGAHLSPRWGPSPLSFNPQRFISTSASGQETLSMPDSAFFAPWSLGARVCPGKKFSQVEFVAVLLHMLADWRIETVRGEGEAETGARERVLNILERKTFNVSVHLVRPEEVRLRFVRREV